MTTKLSPVTPLERNVTRWANARAADYGNKLEGVFSDLFYGGCQSGMVGHLVYYKDTLAFYRKFRADIAALLSNMINQGVLESPAGLNGFDLADPLARETHNQNLLAWFGFEEAARNLCDRAGIEV